MKRLNSIELGLILLIPGAAVVAQDPPTGIPPNAAGQRIYIDPATGKKSVPPPASPPTAGTTNRVGNRPHDLPEVAVKARAGGFKVHLGDRFQVAVTATNRPNGKPIVRSKAATGEVASQPTGSNSNLKNAANGRENQSSRP